MKKHLVVAGLAVISTVLLLLRKNVSNESRSSLGSYYMYDTRNIWRMPTQ